MAFGKIKIAVLASAALFAATASASAATIVWTHWDYPDTSPTTVDGVDGGVGVEYTGQLRGVDFNSASWMPNSTWVGGDVGNAPPMNFGMVSLDGGTNMQESIVFSTAVLDPVIAIWSLGQNNDPTTFNFDLPFTIVAGGPSAEYHGTSITTSGGNIVSGEEGNGTIRFNGLIKEIDFTTPLPENYYGFTVGYGAVPEPATWAMFLLGFGVIGWTLRSQRNKAAVTA